MLKKHFIQALALAGFAAAMLPMAVHADATTDPVEEDIIYEETMDEEVIDDGPAVIYDEDEVIYEAPADQETVVYEDSYVSYEDTVSIFDDDYDVSFFEMAEEESIFSDYQVRSGEIELLARLIHHEAGNQPKAGKIAVGEVVMNRVKSDLFKENTIESVIYAPGQFAENYEIAYMKPSDEEYAIARGVVNGSMKVFDNENVLFFKNPTITSGGRYDSDDIVNWGKYQWYSFIGGHAFYSV
nr:cell wall hydrolase [uncultured Butyrivibrio sp.]